MGRQVFDDVIFKLFKTIFLQRSGIYIISRGKEMPEEVTGKTQDGVLRLMLIACLD